MGLFVVLLGEIRRVHCSKWWRGPVGGPWMWAQMLSTQRRSTSAMLGYLKQLRDLWRQTWSEVMPQSHESAPEIRVYIYFRESLGVKKALRHSSSGVGINRTAFWHPVIGTPSPDWPWNHRTTEKQHNIPGAGNSISRALPIQATFRCFSPFDLHKGK